MTAPTHFPIAVIIAETDYTTYIPWQTYNFDLKYQDVSYVDFTIENAGALSVNKGDQVYVTGRDVPGVLFKGRIIEINKRKRSGAGRQVDYDIQCADEADRLRKTILPYELYSDTDLNILDDWLTLGTPDISSLFDFSTGALDSMGSLDFGVNNESVLDAIRRLAIQNGWYWRFANNMYDGFRINYFKNPRTMDLVGATTSYYMVGAYDTAWSGGTKLDPVAGGSSGYSGSREATIPISVTSGKAFTLGRTLGETAPDMNFRLIWNNNWWITLSFYARATGAGGPFTPDIKAVIYNDNGTYQKDVDLIVTGSLSLGSPSLVYASLAPADWSLAAKIEFQVHDASGALIYYVSAPQIERRYSILDPGAPTAYFDGETASAFWMGDQDNAFSLADDKSILWWDSSPADAPFDIDIQSGDEFAFDLSLFDGSIDEINTVIVVGGYETEAIDRTYYGFAAQQHYDLESQIDTIAVWRNDGTDGTPSWTSLTVGTKGQDTLSSHNVLYEPESHYLEFAAAVSTLEKAFRVTGTIRVPIRVKVEDSAAVAEDGAFATVLIDNDIDSKDAAYAAGQAELDRRSQPTRLQFETYEPGLMPGQEIDITDSDRSLSESLIIQQVLGKATGDGYWYWTVKCGDDVLDAGSVIAGNQQAALPDAPEGDVTTSTVSELLDSLDQDLSDSNALPLYQIA